MVEAGFHKMQKACSQDLGTSLKSNMQTSAYSLSCSNKLLFKLKEALERMVWLEQPQYWLTDCPSRVWRGTDSWSDPWGEWMGGWQTDGRQYCGLSKQLGRKLVSFSSASEQEKQLKYLTVESDLWWIGDWDIPAFFFH